MNKSKVNEEALRDILEKEYANARDFDWTGWRIPIYLNEDGTLSAGEWLSNNSYQPDAFELTSVERWTFTEWDPDFEGTKEEEEEFVEEAIDWMVDEHIRRLRENVERGEIEVELN